MSQVNYSTFVLPDQSCFLSSSLPSYCKWMAIWILPEIAIPTHPHPPTLTSLTEQRTLWKSPGRQGTKEPLAMSWEHNPNICTAQVTEDQNLLLTVHPAQPDRHPFQNSCCRPRWWRSFLCVSSYITVFSPLPSRGAPFNIPKSPVLTDYKLCHYRPVFKGCSVPSTKWLLRYDIEGRKSLTTFTTAWSW